MVRVPIPRLTPKGWTPAAAAATPAAAPAAAPPPVPVVPPPPVPQPPAAPPVDPNAPDAQGRYPQFEGYIRPPLDPRLAFKNKSIGYQSWKLATDRRNAMNQQQGQQGQGQGQGQEQLNLDPEAMLEGEIRRDHAAGFDVSCPGPSSSPRCE